VSSTPSPRTLTELRSAWEAAVAENPRLRERDAALLLGVPEAALVASLPATQAVPLKPDWRALFHGLEAAGRLTAITRNDSAVHEKHGLYRHIEMDDRQGVVHDKDIDLRFFPGAFGRAWAVTKETAHGTKKSIQIFDRWGDAAHKIWSTESTDLAAFDALVASLTDTAAMPDGDAPVPTFDPAPAPTAAKPVESIDVEGFRTAWRNMKDTHEFFGMVHRFGVDRLQALELAPEGMATSVPLDTCEKLLAAVAEEKTPIMVFIGNRGAIQIHTDPVEKVAASGPWLNVLDEGFNLHLRRDQVASAWLVVKPTEDGLVHSLELFDKDRVLIAQFFGARKPGVPELKAWTETLKRIATPTAVNA